MVHPGAEGWKRAAREAGRTGRLDELRNDNHRHAGSDPTGADIVAVWVVMLAGVVISLDEEVGAPDDDDSWAPEGGGGGGELMSRP